MATYKVPQDVEADDKLIGPFSFRQFIYLIIVALSIALAWGLAQVFIVLAIIPLPIILLFGALALPLRKDQPMEIYMAAMLAYFLKPRRRIWEADGIDSLIEITAPKVVEKKLTKDLSQEDAEQRISYLANIVDSGGWAIRGEGAQNTSMNNDILLEAQSAQDLFDTSSSVSRSFDNMMSRRTEELKQEAMDKMFQPSAPVAEPESVAPDANPYFNPYAPGMQQAVIQPISDPQYQFTDPADDQTPADQPVTTSDNTVSAGIMNLANNTDLSIETIAQQAQRINKDTAQDEVVISLR